MSWAGHKRRDDDVTRPHRRVGNVAPGAVSGRSANLDGRRFRERSEDQVRWDPVDEVHYVSTSRGSMTDDRAGNPRREQRERPRRPERPAAEEAPSQERGQERPSQREVRRPRPQPRPQPRVTARDRASAAFAGVRSFPGRVVAWVSRHRRLSVAFACVVLAVVMVYGPVQRYYVAWREAGDLQAEADALNADNDALRSDLSRLQSKEGIEDEARRRGYTYSGEESTTAEGVSDDQNQGSSGMESDFSAADIEQPWYIHVLDFIFVYEGVS